MRFEPSIKKRESFNQLKPSGYKTQTKMKNVIENKVIETLLKEVVIETLLKEVRTIEIYSSDVENIYDKKYLESVLKRLETNEEELNVCLMSVKDRIREIKDNDERENEVKENLKQIEELEEFIRNVCDSSEDTEEPLSKIEELLEDNNYLNEEITKFYENLKN